MDQRFWNRSMAPTVLALTLVWTLSGCATPLPPAPTAPAGQRIAVLTLTVESDETGRVVSVILEEGKIVPGFGPNVFGLAGPWTVVLARGDVEPIIYGTLDPRWVEVENPEGDPPFSSMLEPSVTFDLVVPLAAPDGTDLEVNAIGLIDETGQLIFLVGVEGDELTPFEQPPTGLLRIFRPFLRRVE